MNSPDHNGSSHVETHPAPRVNLQAGETPPPQPKLGRWLLVVIVLVVLGVVAGLLPRLSREKALATETTALATPTVNVVLPVPGKATASLMLPAEVRAFVEAPIYARADGYIKKWYKDIGARVEVGDLLADIDSPELDQQLNGARAELVQAEAALALSKITATRWSELLKTSSVSEQENAEKQADLALKVANVDASRANAERLKNLQDFTHVKAPFAGTLTIRDIDVGNLIGSGKELFRLADTTKLRVFVRVPQSATPDIATGLDAEMTVPEMPARKFTAKVVRTSGAIDANSRTLLTELEVDNSKNELLAGAFAQVSFRDLKQDPSMVLPSNTLLFRAEGPQVGVVAADGHVELHTVILGRDFGKTLEILSGVGLADRVIINPSDSLVAGSIVRIAESDLAMAGKSEKAK
ncbi:MAG: family efflux transporter, subunit [Pedosphaera sp.]|nr:family efflux transporter, subunit [Pedosphaera sp.]